MTDSCGRPKAAVRSVLVNWQSPIVVACSALVAFLVGSIPFGLLVARARGVDIRKHGSGNIGATNVGRVLGRRAGLTVFALDLLKGLAPTLAYGLLSGGTGSLSLPAHHAWHWLLVMISPILGHMFCPWIGFKGGKGVASALGALLGVFPALTLAGFAAAIVWFASLWLWSMVGLSSVLAAAALPVAVVGLLMARGVDPVGSGLPFVLTSAALALVVIFKHRANLSRVLKGTEPKVTWLRGKK